MKSRTAAGGMILALGLLTAGQPAAANNIAATNVALTNQTVVAQTVEVQFDLSWDNSWRSAAADPAYTNWDAAWVFVKFKGAAGNWQHATLSTNAGAHTPAANSTIDPVFDGKGAFVYRSSGYSGAVAYTGVRLRWNYGADNCSFPADAALTVSVHAIEMVSVPQGAFFLGSVGNESGSFTEGAWVSGAAIPFLITETWDRQIAKSSGKLWGTSENTIGTAGNLIYNNTIGRAGNLNASFPSGYNAFYCMKYELTQGQYTDFLNKLTATQAGNRYSAASMSPDYTIGVNTAGEYTNGAPDRACNWLSWADGLAYADWAGLRPMTELEYEKACRGPATPVTNEFAWGNATVPPQSTQTAGAAEKRQGRKHATARPDRTPAGATYWGIMEMSGNLWERPVSVGTSAERGFTGEHGDGKLTAAGAADARHWPWPMDGGGLRGGSWMDALLWSRVADRALATSAVAFRGFVCGWRGARSVP